MNFINEEVYGYNNDIDSIKPLISRKFVKTLTYFNKYNIYDMSKSQLCLDAPKLNK